MPRNTAFGNPTIHPDEDEFNRWPFSRALADRIAGLGSPEGAAVIGLYARWGYGKSSVLNFIKYRLQKEHSTKATLFEFNPWLFTDRDGLLTAFYTRLASELDVALKGTTQKVGKLVAEFSGALTGVPLAGGALKSVADYFGKRMAEDPIEGRHAKIKEIMAGSKKIVVALIDDLDRLERDEIVLMLKLVRLTGDIPNVVYVLSFDDEMVAQAVRSYYGNSQEAGRQFIEKIVQFPFVIPAVGQERLVEYTLKHARSSAGTAGLSIGEDSWADFRKLTQDSLIHRLTTPRQAIRYRSALDFALPMLKDEVDPLQQMVVEGIRVLFPELYAHIRDRDVTLTREDWLSMSPDALEAHAQQAMNQSSEQEKRAATILLRFLFRSPEVRQPAADPRYFRRLFSYALATDEITDAEMASLLSYAETGEDRLTALVQKLAERNPDELLTLVQKLVERNPEELTELSKRLRNRRGKGWLSEKTCEELSRVLASNGALFVKNKPVKDDDRAKKLAEILGRFVQYHSTDVHKRHELAALILRSVEPLALAPMFIDWLSKLNQRKKVNPSALLVITDDGWPLLARAFVPRVRDLIAREQANMFEQGTDASALFSLWERYGCGTLKEWIDARIKVNGGFTLRLLRHYKTSFGERSYAFLCAAASPSVIREALAKQFGDALKDENENTGDIGLARGFLREYEEQTAKRLL
jgi:hypothetical protein